MFQVPTVVPRVAVTAAREAIATIVVTKMTFPMMMEEVMNQAASTVIEMMATRIVPETRPVFMNQTVIVIEMMAAIMSISVEEANHLLSVRCCKQNARQGFRIAPPWFWRKMNVRRTSSYPSFGL